MATATSASPSRSPRGRASQAPRVGRLFFVCGKARPIDPKGCEGYLLRVNASEREGPYVAATKLALAYRFIFASKLGSKCFVLASDQIGANHYFDFSRRQVLVLQSAADVEALLASPTEFPYALYSTRYKHPVKSRFKPRG